MIPTPFPLQAKAFALAFLLAAGAHAEGLTLDQWLRAGQDRNRELLVGRQEVATAAVDTQDAATAVNPHLEVEAMHNLTEPESPTAP